MPSPLTLQLSNEIELWEGRRELVGYLRIARSEMGVQVEIKRVTGARAHKWIPFMGIVGMNGDILFALMGPRGSLRQGKIDGDSTITDLNAKSPLGDDTSVRGTPLGEDVPGKDV